MEYTPYVVTMQGLVTWQREVRTDPEVPRLVVRHDSSVRGRYVCKTRDVAESYAFIHALVSDKRRASDIIRRWTEMVLTAKGWADAGALYAATREWAKGDGFHARAKAGGMSIALEVVRHTHELLKSRVTDTSKAVEDAFQLYRHLLGAIEPGARQDPIVRGTVACPLCDRALEPGVLVYVGRRMDGHVEKKEEDLRVIRRVACRESHQLSGDDNRAPLPKEPVRAQAPQPGQARQEPQPGQAPQALQPGQTPQALQPGRAADTRSLAHSTKSHVHVNVDGGVRAYHVSDGGISTFRALAERIRHVTGKGLEGYRFFGVIAGRTVEYKGKLTAAIVEAHSDTPSAMFFRPGTAEDDRLAQSAARAAEASAVAAAISGPLVASPGAPGMVDERSARPLGEGPMSLMVIYHAAGGSRQLFRVSVPSGSTLHQAREIISADVGQSLLAYVFYTSVNGTEVSYKSLQKITPAFQQRHATAATAVLLRISSKVTDKQAKQREDESKALERKGVQQSEREEIKAASGQGVGEKTYQLPIECVIHGREPFTHVFGFTVKVNGRFPTFASVRKDIAGRLEVDAGQLKEYDFYIGNLAVGKRGGKAEPLSAGMVAMTANSPMTFEPNRKKSDSAAAREAKEREEIERREAEGDDAMHVEPASGDRSFLVPVQCYIDDSEDGEVMFFFPFTVKKGGKGKFPMFSRIRRGIADHTGIDLKELSGHDFYIGEKLVGKKEGRRDGEPEPITEAWIAKLDDPSTGHCVVFERNRVLAQRGLRDAARRVEQSRREAEEMEDRPAEEERAIAALQPRSPEITVDCVVGDAEFPFTFEVKKDRKQESPLVSKLISAIARHLRQPVTALKGYDLYIDNSLLNRDMHLSDSIVERVNGGAPLTFERNRDAVRSAEEVAARENAEFDAPVELPPLHNARVLAVHLMREGVKIGDREYLWTSADDLPTFSRIKKGFEQLRKSESKYYRFYVDGVDRPVDTAERRQVTPAIMERLGKNALSLELDRDVAMQRERDAEALRVANAMDAKDLEASPAAVDATKTIYVKYGMDREAKITGTAHLDVTPDETRFRDIVQQIKDGLSKYPDVPRPGPHWLLYASKATTRPLRDGDKITEALCNRNAREEEDGKGPLYFVYSRSRRHSEKESERKELARLEEQEKKDGERKTKRQREEEDEANKALVVAERVAPAERTKTIYVQCGDPVSRTLSVEMRLRATVTDLRHTVEADLKGTYTEDWLMYRNSVADAQLNGRTLIEHLSVGGNKEESEDFTKGPVFFELNRRTAAKERERRRKAELASANALRLARLARAREQKAADERARDRELQVRFVGPDNNEKFKLAIVRGNVTYRGLLEQVLPPELSGYIEHFWVGSKAVALDDFVRQEELVSSTNAPLVISAAPGLRLRMEQDRLRTPVQHPLQPAPVSGAPRPDDEAQPPPAKASKQANANAPGLANPPQQPPQPTQASGPANANAPGLANPPQQPPQPAQAPKPAEPQPQQQPQAPKSAGPQQQQSQSAQALKPASPPQSAKNPEPAKLPQAPGQPQQPPPAQAPGQPQQPPPAQALGQPQQPPPAQALGQPQQPPATDLQSAKPPQPSDVPRPASRPPSPRGEDVQRPNVSKAPAADDSGSETESVMSRGHAKRSRPAPVPALAPVPVPAPVPAPAAAPSESDSESDSGETAAAARRLKELEEDS
jgi:hypothetical protein